MSKRFSPRAVRAVDLEEARRLCQLLPLMKERLIRAGLLKTGHAIEAAVTQVGYETAEAIGSQTPAEKP